MVDPVRAAARVVLTIEVSVRSAWGPECSMDQVYKQAAEEALGFIENTVKNKMPEARARIKILGQPKIEAILVRSGD